MFQFAPPAEPDPEWVTSVTLVISRLNVRRVPLSDGVLPLS